MPSTITRRRSARVFLQIAALPIVAGAVTAGVWIAGGVLTDDFRASVALTALWFALSGALCLVVAIRSRFLRFPVVTAYLVTAGVIGVFLASTTLRDRVVDEQVVMGVTPSQAAHAPAPEAARRQNLRLWQGRFISGEHATRGTAAVVRLADGRRVLTLTSFATSPGPDLRVRIASSRTLDGGASDAVDLGGLKGNRGDQQYRVPNGVSLAGRAVVIWCRAFSARFGSAVLER